MQRGRALKEVTGSCRKPQSNSFSLQVLVYYGLFRKLSVFAVRVTLTFDVDFVKPDSCKVGPVEHVGSF